jgi:hypothetical protein
VAAKVWNNNDMNKQNQGNILVMYNIEIIIYHILAVATGTSLT